ncbi:PH domain-containing protein [Gottfriedia sp. NPDC057991]|uniref:PH domain-containing protein n=1 Tax=Gottfriedia sp. NPDC057991 TaxID=3346298 RepID=UPI0036DEF6BE
MVILSLLGIAALIIAVLVIMGQADRSELQQFKVNNPELYIKYKGAHDAYPGDYSGVVITRDIAEKRLLPDEKVIHSYFIARIDGYDANLYLVTNKRTLHIGSKLTKTKMKTIPHNKIENIEVNSGTLSTELVIESKEENIKIRFSAVHKSDLDGFYVYLSEQQLKEKAKYNPLLEGLFLCHLVLPKHKSFFHQLITYSFLCLNLMKTTRLFRMCSRCSNEFWLVNC